LFSQSANLFEKSDQFEKRRDVMTKTVKITILVTPFSGACFDLLN
jgi:hypothetical protein